MQTIRHIITILLSLAFIQFGGFSVAQTEVYPPNQPSSGPGGADYPHQGFKCFEYGEGKSKYWIYEPADPKPSSAPVIVFNHGWGAIDPAPYSRWLEHLARKGNIVIYPAYQEKVLSPAVYYTENAIQAVKSAKMHLDSESEHVFPNWDAFLIAGHSMGGLVTINMACLWQDYGLPEPKAILSVEPADPVETQLFVGRNQPSLIANIRKLSPTLKMVITLGSDDEVIKDSVARFVYEQSTQIPITQKNLLTLQTDDHGNEVLLADHSSPLTSGGFRREGEVDALDYFGYWRLLDALRDTVYLGTNEIYALGNSNEMRFMGKWSDGTAVKEISVAELQNSNPFALGPWLYFYQYPWIFNQTESRWYYYKILHQDEIWVQNPDDYSWQYAVSIP